MADKCPCTYPESFVRGGPTLTFFFFLFSFLVDEGREDLNTTISRPSLARQRNIIQLPVTIFVLFPKTNFSRNLEINKI